MKEIDQRLDLDNYVKDCCQQVNDQELDQAIFFLRAKEETEELFVSFTGDAGLMSAAVASMMFQSDEFYNVIAEAIDTYNEIDENDSIQVDVSDN